MDLVEEAMDGELVLVAGKLYRHVDFVDAMHDTFLKRLSDVVPQGASVKQACKALAGFKTEEAHAATLKEAIAVLCARTAPVDPDSLQQGKHAVVATFSVET